MIKFVSSSFLFASLVFSTSCLAQSSPKNLYIHHCIGCHALDGSGAPEVGVPSMNGMLGKFLQIPGGREYIVQVPGVMNSPLNDAEVARLMNWLVVAMGPKPNRDFPPYSSSEIQSLRQTIPENIGAVRAKLVKLIDTN